MTSSLYQRSLIAAAVAAVAALATVLAAFLHISYSLAADEAFALIRHTTFIPRPGTQHLRFRADEYGTDKHDRFFFQWSHRHTRAHTALPLLSRPLTDSLARLRCCLCRWNYLIVDSATNEQYQFVFQLNYHSARFQLEPSTALLLVAAKAQHGDGSTVYEAADSYPLQQVGLSQHMDITAPLYSQVAVDNDTYTFTAAFPSNRTRSNLPLSFHVTLHRLHGMYSGEESEESNVKNCLISSNIFAFNSRASGWWSSGPEHNVSFSASSERFRAYGGASWGCQLPHTDSKDPLHYPWTWVWLSVPRSGTRPDLSISVGTAAFDLGWVGTLRAGLMAVGWGDEIVGAVYATLNSDTAFRLPVLSAASDGFLTAFTPNFSDWTPSSSEPAAAMGSFTLPLTQSYTVTTATLDLTVTSHSPSLSAFFRAPVVTEDATSAQVRLYSDFRANAVDVHVRLARRAAGGASGEVLYEGEARINACEYAYEAQLLESAESILSRVSSVRGWQDAEVAVKSEL